MPSPSTRRRRTAAPSTIDAPTAALELAGDDTEIDAADPAVTIETEPEPKTFFELLREIPPADWENRILYLYRLEPKVFNGDGRAAWIDKYSTAVDESDIAPVHGGGKYQLWLNDTERRITIKKHQFTIGGQPIMQPGQQLKQQPAVAAAPAVAPAVEAAGQGSTADLVKAIAEVIRDTRSNNTSPDAAASMVIEQMTAANKASLEIVKAGILQQNANAAGSTTGNPILDRLLTSAIENLTKPAAERDQLGELTKMITVIDKMRGNQDPAPAAVDPVAQLVMLKEKLGLDLGNGEGGGGASALLAPLAGAIPQLVDAVPKVFEHLRDSKRIELEIARTNLQREQIRARALERQASLPAGALSAVQPASGNAGTSDSSDSALAHGAEFDSAPLPSMQPSAAEQQQARLNEAATLIIRSAQEGRDGAFAAAMLDITHPDITAVLEQVASDKAAIMGFISQHPILSQLSTTFDTEQLNAFVDEFSGFFENDGDAEDEITVPAGAGAGVTA